MNNLILNLNGTTVFIIALSSATGFIRTILCIVHPQQLSSPTTDLKLPRQHPPSVDVARVSLNGLIVAKDLGSGRCGHRSQEQAVPHAMSAIKKYNVLHSKGGVLNQTYQ